MERNEIVKVITTYLKDVTEIENELNNETIVTIESGIITDNVLRLSSLQYVEMIVYLEEKMDVIYDFDTKLNTIGEMADYFLDHMNDESYRLHAHRDN